MKKWLLLIVFFSLIFSSINVQAKELQSKLDVPVNKSWTINFTKTLDINSVDNSSVYIEDVNNNRVSATIKVINDNKAIFITPDTTYNNGTQYTIHVTNKVKNSDGINLKDEVIMRFTTIKSDTNKIVLGWNYLYDASANAIQYHSSEDYIMKNSSTQGMNVISPTWFQLQEDGINIKNIADLQYSSVAHKNGYKVWALFSGISYTGSTSINLVNKILSDSNAVDNIVEKMATYCSQYNIDGINVDFEGMGKINKDVFTNFIGKLSDRLHKDGVQVSVDVTKPVQASAYSECYDLPNLANYADYIIFMAYDEHWTGDIEAGSVGSYDWVEDGIQKILNSGVPKDKLILGVPFYTRDFAVVEVNPEYNAVVITTKDSKIYSEASESSTILNVCHYGDVFKYDSTVGDWYLVDYNGTKGYIRKNNQYVSANTEKTFAVGWSTASMDQINLIVKDKTNDSLVQYDNSTKQNVLVYYKMDSSNTVKLKHIVWLEDEQSMLWRTNLVNKYNLSGLAAWKLEDESEKIWDVIKNSLSK
jgi:spore germination protein YaaH